MTSNKAFRNLAISLFFIFLLAYSNHFQNDFHFDDFHTIVDNVAIKKLSNIPRFFTDASLFSASPNHHHLRPVVTTSLAIDYAMGGDLIPFWFHLSTFLWHIALCVLLFLLYKILLNTSFSNDWVKYVALFGAAWFAVHVAVAETVNYIISRSDILSTFFIVLSLYVFVRYPARRKQFLYIIPAIIGVFAKETVAVLIIILFFYLVLFEKGLSISDIFKKANFRKIWGVIVSLIPIILVVGLVQYYTLSQVKGQTISYGLSNPVGYYWLTQTYVWLLYFKSFFLPTHLVADTDLEVILTIWDKRILAGLIFVTLLFFTIFKTSNQVKTRPIAFGLIWFAASLLPTSVMPFSEVMNDHRMYFAFTGLTLSVITAIYYFISRKQSPVTASPKTKQWLVVFAFLVIILNAFGTFQRNKVWRTEESLWLDVTEKSPSNGRGMMNYGLSQMSKGKMDVAVEYFEKARQLVPNYNLVYVNLGIASGALGRQAQADAYFKQATQLNPNEAESFSFYARYLAQNGRAVEAKDMADRALSINAADKVSLDAKMSALQTLKMWDELERTALAQLSYFPNDPAGLQFLNAAKNRQESTVNPVQTIINDPKTADDFLNLSLLYYSQGKFTECIEACGKVLKLNPNSADAYSNMCAAYNSLQQWDKGKEACEKALEINPQHVLANGNMKWNAQRTP